MAARMTGASPVVSTILNKPQNDMKIREIIVERVSLSANIPEVSRLLTNIIKHIIGKPPKTIPEKIDFNFMGIQNTKLVDAIVPALVTFAKQSQNVNVDVKFVRLPAGVGAAFIPDENTIKMSSTMLTDLIRLFFKYFTTGEDIMADVSNVVAKMTAVFIHELTHVVQVTRGAGNHEKSMLYNKAAVDKYVDSLEPDRKKQSAMLKTAGITRNQINVNLAKLDLENEIVKPENIAIYKAQPEEISAFAHEYAVKQLSPILNKPKAEQLSFIDNSLRALATEAKDDNNPYSGMNTPEYQKVYRRFLKTIYGLLIDYRETLSP